ncbi:hypothetical protein Poly51_59630 [Rubripirellula tenax]|uniref:Uncharacterized protein n=1 Tax=Rubripirellula tenax TaxID=2528015 RepID=A0A5C6E834_9BACT|nr:hypothetical protein [Rubripirellula tenax]TWU44694.1 hypothetical protein Poly51_59630 [Rubripirellula tenax]
MNADANTLIDAFRGYCGVEVFRKFVAATNRECRIKQRLMFWQQDKWESFVATHAEYAALEFADIANAFRICHVHELPLHDDHVPAVYGRWHFPDGYLETKNDEFPYANLMFCGDSGQRRRHSNQDVEYCSACREALLQWNDGREHTCGIP